MEMMRNILYYCSGIVSVTDTAHLGVTPVNTYVCRSVGMYNVVGTVILSSNGQIRCHM